MARRRGLLGLLGGLFAGQRKASRKRARAREGAEAAAERERKAREKAAAKAQRDAEREHQRIAKLAAKTAKRVKADQDRRVKRQAKADRERQRRRELKAYRKAFGRLSNPHVMNTVPARDRRSLSAAERMSQEFHGTPHEVLTLTKAERRPLSESVAVIGVLPEITYQPDAHSQRGGSRWQHESGDRGPGQSRSSGTPILVADPKTERAQIVYRKSGMKFDSSKGLIG